MDAQSPQHQAQATGPTRRHVLSGLVASAVVGFSTFSQTWVTAAQAATSATPIDPLPPLDGTVSFDNESKLLDSRDEGNIVTRLPFAVLRPGSASDVAAMIRYCRRHHLKVAARGQAHTTFGQGLTTGLLIENRSLQQIHSIRPDVADVDAGVLWTELMEAAVAQNLTPPLFTDYTDLSIAGTLTVGGVSSHNNQGLQIDHVQELEVVTGTGAIMSCSMTNNRDLFEAALGGLGQFGIITRAKISLVPAKPLVRVYLLHYTDNAVFFRDLRALLDRGEMDGVINRWIPNPDGTLGLTYELVANIAYDPAQPPDDERLLRGLSQPPTAVGKADLPYPVFITQVNSLVDFFKQALNWDSLVKPWLDVWLSDTAVEQYVADLVASLGPDDIGAGGFFVLAAQRRSKVTRPFFRVPAPDGSDWIYLVDLLTAFPGPNPELTDKMLKRNRRLFDAAHKTGGTRYPIGAIEFSQTDWAAQYGDSWPEFVSRKHQFDPDNILTPGVGIF
ncbi:FAD-binding protein [Kribbella sp. NBC_00359]|uniref:FAD-binding protein n=1 Tax=Kribbella sp. NBC_00359 TaxID=2975966 RepID=UPI002E21FDD7